MVNFPLANPSLIIKNSFFNDCEFNNSELENSELKNTKSNNSKFEKDAYIAPTRQYLWSEYFFENKMNLNQNYVLNALFFLDK